MGLKINIIRVIAIRFSKCFHLGHSLGDERMIEATGCSILYLPISNEYNFETFHTYIDQS